MLNSIWESALWDIQPVMFSIQDIPILFLVFVHSSCIFTKGSSPAFFSPGAGQAVVCCVILIPAQGFYNLSMLEELLKRRFPGPTPRVPDSVCLGWGLGMCISNKFSMMMLLFGDCAVRITGIVKGEIDRLWSHVSSIFCSPLAR